MPSTILNSESIQLPADTTANRPAGVSGMVRYNTTANYIEYYNGSSWVILSPIGDGSSAGQAGISANQIKQSTNTNTNGLYWIYVNGTPKQIYCDMNGTYTGDSSYGWMLYQVFGTSNTNIANDSNTLGGRVAYPLNSNGWGNSIDSGTDNSGYVTGWAGGPTVGAWSHNVWQIVTPSVSNYAIKWGNNNGSGQVRLSINGAGNNSITNSTNNSQRVDRGTFSPTGTQIFYLDEYNSCIMGLYWIFVR